MDRIEIDIELENGVQQLGLAWLADYLKSYIEEHIRLSQGPATGVVRKVGEVRILRKTFSTKI